jgi:hypothetical protein
MEFPSTEQIAAMPLSREDLADLFIYLDSQVRPDTCAGDFRHTERYLDGRGLDKATVIEWLGGYGGRCCDCEVMFNVLPKWGEYIFRGRVSDDESPDPA